MANSKITERINPLRWPGYVQTLFNPRSFNNFRKRRLIENGNFVVTAHVNGLELYVDLRGGAGQRRMYFENRHESVETAFFQRHLQPGMTFVDIGANIGYFTTLAAKLVGPTGKVLAFEPDPLNFGLLSRNVDRNGFENATCFNIALGEDCRTAVLHKSATNHGDHRLIETDDPHRETLDVVCKTFDSVFDGPIDAIKLDVQGFELSVLRGMQETLNRSDNLAMLFEFSPEHLQTAGVGPPVLLEFLREHNFQLHRLNETGDEQPISDGDIFDSIDPASRRIRDRYLNLVARKM